MPENCAVIIGSGFDSLADGRSEESVRTRFGVPSAPLRRGSIAGQEVVTLARHGDEHTLSPHVINYRANLLALKAASVTTVIALATVGVVSNVRKPGEVAVPDQIIDYTSGREQTIYDGSDGRVENIDFTQPFTALLRKELLDAATSAKVDCFDGGVYAATQGPRLESAAEIDRLERDGADFVGMTVMPEAAIARELDLRYACLSLVVNKAAGRSNTPIHEDVEASTVIANAHVNEILHAFFSRPDV